MTNPYEGLRKDLLAKGWAWPLVEVLIGNIIVGNMTRSQVVAMPVSCPAASEDVKNTCQEMETTDGN